MNLEQDMLLTQQVPDKIAAIAMDAKANCPHSGHKTEPPTPYGVGGSVMSRPYGYVQVGRIFSSAFRPKWSFDK